MKHHMKAALSHLHSHHSKGDDHHRAHGGHCGEKVHFSGGHPGKGKNMTPGKAAMEGRKLTREEED